MAKKKEFPILGHWRITHMDMWDQDFVDAEVPGFIEIEAGGMGHFQFGYVRANLDAREGMRDGKPAVEFSFEGMDEIRLSRLASLAAMLARREQVRAAQELLVHGGMVLSQLFYYRLEPNHH